MPLPDTGVAVSALPVATSPDAFDLLGVQGGVTKKLASTLLATQAELNTHAHTGTYVSEGVLVINVKHPTYGAVGDGVADDTAAIKAAINACGYGDTLFFPRGKYKVVSALTLTKAIRVAGVGWVCTMFDQPYGAAAWQPANYTATAGVFGSVIVYTGASGNCFDWQVGVVAAPTFANVAVVGPGSGTSQGITTGRNAAGVVGAVFDNVLVANFPVGVAWNNVQDSETRSLFTASCASGFTLNNACNENTHVNYKANRCTTYGVRVGSLGLLPCQGNTFIAPLVQACTGTGFSLENATHSTVIDHPWFENSGITNAVVSDATSTNTVVGNVAKVTGADKFVFNGPDCRLEWPTGFASAYAGVGVTFGAAAVRGVVLLGEGNPPSMPGWLADNSGELALTQHGNGIVHHSVNLVTSHQYAKAGTKTPRGATGSRPAAGAFSGGEGAQWYDTTLKLPLWSDGTTWRTAESVDKVFVPAGAMGPPSAGPTLERIPSSDPQQAAWLLDAAATEYISATIMGLPRGWATISIKLVWTNAGAGAGDVRFLAQAGYVSDAGSLTAGGTVVSGVVVATAPAQNVLKHTVLAASVTAPTTGQIIAFDIRRTGPDAADTLPNDCAVLGLLIEPVTFA